MKSERSWITVLIFQQRDGSHSHSICRYYKFIKLYSELFIYERNVLLVQDINRIHWLCQSSGYPGWHKKEDEVTKRWRCLHGTDSEGHGMWWTWRKIPHTQEGALSSDNANFYRLPPVSSSLPNSVFFIFIPWAFESELPLLFSKWYLKGLKFNTIQINMRHHSAHRFSCPINTVFLNFV